MQHTPAERLPDHPLLEGAAVRPCGEAAVVIEFGETIDAAVQQRAIRLADALDRLAPAGLRETVPTYRSTLIEFDPLLTDWPALLAALPLEPGAEVAGTGRHLEVAVCLDGECAEDLDEFARACDLSAEAVRARLTASELRVGMFGFAPGFSYLYGLDPALYVPRRTTPRPPMPAGSLIVAVGQAGFSPVSLPTGWYVVGRTPARLFDAGAASSGNGAPVPFGLGDRLTLKPVDRAAFDALARAPERAVRQVRDDG